MGIFVEYFKIHYVRVRYHIAIGSYWKYTYITLHIKISFIINFLLNRSALNWWEKCIATGGLIGARGPQVFIKSFWTSIMNEFSRKDTLSINGVIYFIANKNTSYDMHHFYIG